MGSKKWSLDDTFKKYPDATFFMINSFRSAGKSTTSLIWAVDNFLENGEQIIWMRRTQEQIKILKDTFWNKIRELPQYTDHKFTQKGLSLFIDNKFFGFLMGLSGYGKIKGMQLPHVTNIFFDEYVPEIDERYLPNEGIKIASILKTVGRGRFVRIICLGNNVSINNFYWQKFGFKKIPGQEYQKIGQKVIQEMSPDKYLEYSDSDEDPNNEIFENLGTLDFNSSNAEFDKSEIHVKKLTARHNCYKTILSNNDYFTFYIKRNLENNLSETLEIVIDNKDNPTSNKLAMTTSDVLDDEQILTGFESPERAELISILSTAKRSNQIYFTSALCRVKSLDLLKKLHVY